MSRTGVAVERVQTGDPTVDAIWRRIRELADTINAIPSGRLLTEEDGAVRGSGLSFTSGIARSIPHGLGRRAKGFIEVQSNDAPSVAQVGLRATKHPNGKTSSDYVTVTPTNTGTCYLLVL
jgi:hypothetical protein